MPVFMSIFVLNTTKSSANDLFMKTLKKTQSNKWYEKASRNKFSFHGLKWNPNLSLTETFFPETFFSSHKYI